MSGCHWQSPYETFCCCQFDGCNEWKSDGTEYKKGETIPLDTSMMSSRSSSEKVPSRQLDTMGRSSGKVSSSLNDEIRLD
ncbi:hypothetical protein DICVIV_00992 [Dictyocaulus viviparus]|uniref:Uncharacterized protein n=1 Tax=Dictyocaulus viviparus TaxID=29172 RepID=A0A0D8Y7U8_DICVI|nr:hypothetical protein DICVIV_00992 [Dictyocaulus viviparus]